MARTTAASTLSLGGLLQHLSLVEDWWFSAAIEDTLLSAPFDASDVESDPDYECRSAAEDLPAQLHEWWAGSVERKAIDGQTGE